MGSVDKDELYASVTDHDLRIMLDQLPRLVVMLELDGTILFWNGGGERVFGYSREEAEGKPIWFLYPDRSKKEFDEDLKRLKEGSEISFEAEGVCKDGNRIWLDIKRVLMNDSRGRTVILGTASDISLQKKAEMDLSENRARTEAILKTAEEGIITIDTTGMIQSFNHAAEEMFGYREKEVLGENISILMPSPYLEEHDRYIKNYLETGERKIIGIGREVRGKKKDGTVFPIELSVSEINFNGEIIFAGLIRDISERRKLENEVLEIAEDERRRIGQELHDGLGQMLSGIRLISRNLARKLKVNELAGADEVMEISEMIREADEHARNMAHGLAHIELENEGLKVAMSRLCDQFQNYYDAQCEFECPSNFTIEKRTVSLHLYRITQEAIHNAIKHGEATRIRVKVEVNEHYLQLFIEDNGMGFAAPEELQRKKGMGVHTMNYRAHMLGGNLKIGENSEGWTRVACTVPISKDKTESKK